jgi:hypothetical protein
VALRLRMTWLAAGVDRMPFWPTNNFFTPYAAPILAISWMTSGFQYRPSPPITRKAPRIRLLVSFSASYNITRQPTQVCGQASHLQRPQGWTGGCL